MDTILFTTLLTAAATAVAIGLAVVIRDVAERNRRHRLAEIERRRRKEDERLGITYRQQPLSRAR